MGWGGYGDGGWMVCGSWSMVSIFAVADSAAAAVADASRA